MTRLEELRKQKREIEAEIKKLTNQTIEVGRCKFYKQHYGTCRPDEWTVTFKSMSEYYPQEERNRKIIMHSDRDIAISEITEAIKDLTDLKKLLEEMPYEE